jgi:uncharacterized protein YhaN
MHLSKLEIQEFGVFQAATFESMGPGLTVVFGRNETGKTTLMHFLRGMLYGFSSAERRKYLVPRPPADAALHSGGKLHIETASGLVHELTRTASCAPQEGWVDRITLKADGILASDAQASLSQLLGAIDEATFVRIYAVGLAELQELNLLGNTEAAQLIYRLTSGVDRVSLIDVLDEVNQSRQQFLSADGQAGLLSDLHRRREAAQLRLSELERRGGQWARLASRRNATASKIKDVEGEIEKLEDFRRSTEMARRVYREWQQHVVVTRQIESLSAQVPVAFAIFSDDPIARLDDFEKQIVECRAEIDAMREERQRLRSDADDLDVNRQLVQQAPRIDAMAELAGWVAHLEGQRQGMESEVSRMEEHLCQSYGIQVAGDGVDVSPITITSSTVTALRGPARQLREQKQRLRDADKASHEADLEVELTVRSLDAAFAAAGCIELDVELEAIAARTALLRRQESTGDRLSHLRASREEVVAGLSEPSTAELLSPRAIVGIGGSFVAGFMCLSAAVLFGGWLGMSGAVRGITAVCGMGAVLGSLALKFLIQRNNVARLGLQKRQLDVLARQEKECIREGADLDSELGPADGSPEAERAQCASRLVELEELVPLEAARRAASQNSESMAIRLEHARSSFSAAEERWNNALQQAGLPLTLLPRHVRQYASEQKYLQEQQRQLEQRKLDVSRCRMELDSLRRRVEQAYQDAGVEPSDSDLSFMLRELTSVLSAEKAKLASHRSLAKKDRSLRKRIGKHKVLIEEFETRRSSMFTQTGCATELDFRTQAASHGEFLKLRARLAELETAIDLAIGEEVVRSDVEQVLSGKDDSDLSADVVRIADRIQSEQERRGELKQRAGMLDSEMRAAEDDGALAMAALELAEIQHELSLAVQSWRSWETTRRILGLVREEYENQRQPETLQEASRWLRKMTGGRYTRVWTPLDEDSLLLDDDAGQVWPLESLSSGTRESVYLSLRLALIEGYRKRGVVLPVVLDDVLVNFDAERTALAIDAISEFADLGHQVLFFTCHAHVNELFSGLDVDSRELELRAAHAPRLRNPATAADDEEQADTIPEAEIASELLVIADGEDVGDAEEPDSPGEKTQHEDDQVEEIEDEQSMPDDDGADDNQRDAA